MAGQWPTLLDLTSRINGAGKQMPIAEMLSQCNDIWDDLPLREANEVGGHDFAFRTSLPAGAWRSYNVGVPYAKSTTAKSRVGVGSLEDYSQVDRMLAEDSGDIQSFRMNEDIAFLEGMGQTMAQCVMYGNTVNIPAQFMGLSTFYNTVTTATAQNASNVLDGNGIGSSNTSLWLIGWSPRTIYGVFPRGSRAGLSMEDKGDTVPGFDAAGNRFEAYTTWFRQQMGIVPEDWRYGVRAANIDVTAAGLAGPNAVDLFAMMAQMVMLPPTLSKRSSGITTSDNPTDPGSGVRPVFYCNRTTRRWMDVQGMRDRNVLITIKDAAGIPQDMYRDIPVKILDQIIITEARVV